MSAALLLSALVSAAMPVVVKRADWDPSPPRLVGVSHYPKLKRGTFQWIVVHHSSFVEPVGPEGIKLYHQQVSGFADIGYHFIITADASIYEGRDLAYMGAHAGECREANLGVYAARHGGDAADVDAARKLDPDWGAIGIVIDGYFDDGFAPTPEQVTSLMWLVDELRKRFGVARDHVIAHREVRDRITLARGLTPAGHTTTCPGDGLMRIVEALRAPPELAAH